MPSPDVPSASLLTPEQAAGFLGVTAGTLNVWRATRRYALPYCKIGRKVMYRAADLEAFAASRLHGNDDGTEPRLTERRPATRQAGRKVRA